MAAWRKIGFIALCIFALIGAAAVVGWVAIMLRLTNTSGIVENEQRYLRAETIKKENAWVQTDEWQTLKKALIADKDAVIRAARDSGTNPRLIVALVVVEQLRLYTSNREIYKDVFKPLQILGVQSQFSWGILGIKQDTAILIEQHLKDPHSSYYLSKDLEHLLNFKMSDPDKERFERLTSENDHYYSYLYAGLYLRQIMGQWEKAGYPISDKPEILSTLYNIGFNNSRPHANPQAGGAEIDINGTVYSFGSLALEFYNSDELLEYFSR